MPNYYYSFTLDFVFFDSQQNRNLDVFIANIQPKNNNSISLANYRKGIPVFKVFENQSFLTNLLIQVFFLFI